MRLSFKINLAILLGSLLALGPLAAFATSHLSLTVGGNQITSIQAGNNIDAVLDGPILTVGANFTKTLGHVESRKSST